MFHQNNLFFNNRKLLQSVQYKGNHVRITCLQYSCHGDYLAIGFDTGHVEILDAVTLNVEGSMSDDEENEARFDYSNDSIKRMAFSHDTAYLACTVSFVYNYFVHLINSFKNSISDSFKNYSYFKVPLHCLSIFYLPPSS